MFINFENACFPNDKKIYTKDGTESVSQLKEQAKSAKKMAGNPMKDTYLFIKYEYHHAQGVLETLSGTAFFEKKALEK